MQLTALMKKRFLYFLRDFQGLSCEIFVPLLVFFVGYMLTNVSYITDLPVIPLDYSTYDYKFTVNSEYSNKLS